MLTVPLGLDLPSRDPSKNMFSEPEFCMNKRHQMCVLSIVVGKSFPAGLDLNFYFDASSFGNSQINTSRGDEPHCPEAVIRSSHQKQSKQFRSHIAAQLLNLLRYRETFLSMDLRLAPKPVVVTIF